MKRPKNGVFGLFFNFFVELVFLSLPYKQKKMLPTNRGIGGYHAIAPPAPALTEKNLLNRNGGSP